MNRDKSHIVYIIESVDLILSLTEKENARCLYDDDWVMKEAILRRLQTLSESAYLLSDVVKNACDGVMWAEIRGFRNALAHGYLAEINDDVVWQVINNNLQPLKKILIKYYEEHYGR